MSLRVFLAITASAIGWGFAAVGVRIAFEAEVSTFTVIDVRIVVSAAAVVLYMVARGRRSSRLAWIHGTYIGVLRIGLAPVLFIASLQHISAGVEALFITLIPVSTGLMAWLFISEPLKPIQVGGLVTGLLGAGLIVLSGDSGLGGGEGDIVAGGLFCLAGVFAGSSSGVLSRKYAPLHETADLAMPMFVTGAALALVASFVFAPADLGELDLPLWVLLVALGLGSTLLPFVGTLYASRYTTAARVSVVGYVAPMISVVAGVLILDEVLTAGIVVGGALALAGALMVSVGRRPVQLTTALRQSPS